jgi:hypothetical protein
MTAERANGPTDTIPELEPIVDAFCDAIALVLTAHAVIVEGRHYGPEESALRQGCEALVRSRDQLEQAAGQLRRFRKSHAAEPD